jgi:hypothetical protein
MFSLRYGLSIIKYHLDEQRLKVLNMNLHL